jgi:selenocysteine lyase/cysteine desulfurase
VTAIESLRTEFPALDRIVYLNTPTAPPAATPVLDAVRRVQDEWAGGEFSWQAWESHAERARHLFAGLIGASVGEVALKTSLSEAAANVARCLPPGRVVVGEHEFRSNLLPWTQLSADREVRVIAARDGLVRTEQIVESIDDGTMLVAVSEVQSSNGFRVRLGDISKRCAEVGARLFVNATQSLGALRLEVDDIDYLGVHGYKWLLGPRGATWLYVKRSLLDEMQPLTPNWKSVADPYDDYYGRPVELAADARKLDASLVWFAWPGARAALELLGRFDARQIEDRCLSLARSFRAEAEEMGLECVPQDAPSQTVGIKVEDPEGLERALAERRVVGAVRGGFLRVGFHAYNNADDVEAALAALRSAA